MPPVVAIEADCNLGKSYATFVGMILPRLKDNPNLPMLFFSVRITHAYDLYETLLKYFKDVEGMNLVCYKDTGEEGVKRACEKATQLVISPQTAALDCLGEHDMNRFRGGVLVLDEAVSLALTIGAHKKGTIGEPWRLHRLFHQLAQVMPHVVVMDRDLTLTPLASKLLAFATPGRDVLHFQFEAPGQDNVFSYAFSGDKECGAMMALKHFLLDAMHCKKTFEDTADDGTPTGPHEWKRLWVVVSSVKRTQDKLLPLLEKLGISHRFYHGEISEAANPRGGGPSKTHLKDTTKYMRDYVVILVTTTVEVAINIELPFYRRWLFTFKCGLFVSAASELMQSVARVPRGTREQQKQRIEHSDIRVLFDGDRPGLDIHRGDPFTEREQEEIERDYAADGEAALREQTRCDQALVELEGVVSAPPVPSFAAPLNALRACARAYKLGHVASKHVVRFFELAMKGRFHFTRPGQSSASVYFVSIGRAGVARPRGTVMQSDELVSRLAALFDAGSCSLPRNEITDLLGDNLLRDHYVE